MVLNKTDVYAVIGDPISHSLSPLIFNTAFQECKLSCIYLAFQIKKGQAKDALNAAKTFGLKGLSVTMPLKEEMANILALSEASKKLNSVNTVLVESSYGTSTDGEGFCQWFESEVKSKIDNLNFLIYGTGGAARSVGLAISEKKGNVSFYGRDYGKTKAAYELINKSPDNKDINYLISKADVFVNATPIGMSATAFEGRSPLTRDQLRKDLIVVDLIYHPLLTPLGKLAKENGCEFYNGLGMLIFQAKVAFEMFFNQEFPLKKVKQVVVNHLQNQ